jgi:alpha-L-rhamnosidase
MKLCSLRVENLDTPFGLDEKRPAFSWQIKTEQPGWKQSAYRITVAASPEHLHAQKDLLWDSGLVKSSRMCGIRYEGADLSCDQRVHWKLFVLSHEGEESAEAASHFHTGLFSESSWAGKWIGETEDFSYPIYRREFSTGHRAIKRASLFVCGLGHYEMEINGKPVSDRLLEPGWTDYRKTLLYSAYDVTHLLQSGANAMAALLGDGMYNVPNKRYVYFERSYGKIKLLCQMNIEYVDGTKEQIFSDENWWKAPGPITFSGIYSGEDYDARLEQKGCSLPGFMQDERWVAASAVKAPKVRLRWQKIPPLVVREEYLPVKIEKTGPGAYLYDLGKNFSGWVKIRLRATQGAAGKVITLTPGELLTNDKAPDQRATGKGYRWQYTMNDSPQPQEYRPCFTYYGFRYVLLTGAVPAELAGENELPVVESLVGQFIYPQVEDAGGFECSVPLFNSIHDIVKQAMKSNMKSIFTDCPHREKLGWMEQVHLIGPGLLHNFDIQNLYEKVIQDITDAQHENGMIPSICPQYVVFGYHEGFNDSPEWGSAGIMAP